MNAATERDMPGDPAGDVELVGPLPAALVTLGQGDQQQGLLIGRSWRRPLIAILRSQGDPKLRQVEKRFKRPRLDLRDCPLNFWLGSNAGSGFRFRHSKVRSLPPQPTIFVFREFPSRREKALPNAGFFLYGPSPDGSSNFLSGKFPKTSGRDNENSRFPETRSGDRGIKPLPGSRQWERE
jgi:hypothetical protein